MEIRVADLKRLTNDLLERLERGGVTRVELSADYYWDVPFKLRYDRYDEPTEHEMGQLSEDLTFINEILDGTRPPVNFALVWVASLLRYIGETVTEAALASGE